MSWRKTTSTRQGTATIYGAVDMNNIMDLFNGVNTGQPVNINNAWNFTTTPTGNVVADGSITSAKIANGAVVDADVSATAAIAKSKLNLASSIGAAEIIDGSIANVEISATAAIAYSKLALGNSIVNADINSAAAIAKSKLAALGIVDADVTGPIAHSKIGTNLIFSETGLTAPRTITHPDAGGKTVLEDNTASLTNKTYDIAGTGNHLTSASAAVGDILTVPSGTDFKRLGKGTAYQYLRVKSDASALEWGDPYVLPSAGRQYGARAGWNSVAGSAAGGVGIMSNVGAANGTGATGSSTVPGTGTGQFVGHAANWTTGTNNTFGRAGWFGTFATMRLLYPIFTIRFQLNAAFVVGQGIFYVGLCTGGQPAANTSITNTFLNGKIGVLFGFRSTDSTFMIMSNNNQATAVYSTAGTPSSSAVDTGRHTISFQLSDSPAQINWWYDGVAMTSITDTVNSVPPSSTASLYPMIVWEAQTATNLQLFEYWSQFSQNWL